MLAGMLRLRRAEGSRSRRDSLGVHSVASHTNRKALQNTSLLCALPRNTAWSAVQAKQVMALSIVSFTGKTRAHAHRPHLSVGADSKERQGAP